ncbi:MAG: Gfo/Idh/MocA family oxidoreductase [Bacteroidales bacterium]|nr:Gfo/Idh/MocA family oxidoreductase [Bacteroidales bacterium]
MKKVITYGTYDLLHEGHLNLLRRAKELGDWLIVGVTNDKFDRERGKLNVRNNVLERVEAVKATGIADQIIIEDYIGQKIDDIQKYGVDIFTVGSDWEGKFDYLKEFCEVVYLPRTEGISSTMLRNETQDTVRIGIAGLGRIAARFVDESAFVSGVEISAIYDIDPSAAEKFALRKGLQNIKDSYSDLLQDVDAVYVATPHPSHYELAREALLAGKHVLCEIPMVLEKAQAKDLHSLAKERGLVLLEAHKTAFSPAFNHLITMIKSGVIGEVVDIDASFSKLLPDRSLREYDPLQGGGSMYELAPYPLLAIFRLLGVNYTNLSLYSRMEDGIDMYTKGIVQYPNAVCSFKLGLGVKTEGNLVISGTKGYAYVPAPWWLTDYFELRYEDQNQNKKFFYKWDGQGLRYEIQEFIQCIVNKRMTSIKMLPPISIAIAGALEEFTCKKNFVKI